MLLLTLGLVAFIGVHLLPASPSLRDRMIASWGQAPYSAVFSAISLIGLVLIALGYQALRASPLNVEIWPSTDLAKHLATASMLPATIFIHAAYVPSRIRDILKHPMLLAIKIWALAHLLANGDLASILLFGSFLAYAVFDRISVEGRGAKGPLGTRTGGPMNDVIVVAAGSALYLVMLLWGHEWLFGVRPLG